MAQAYEKARSRLRAGPVSVFVGRSGERSIAPSPFQLDVHDDDGPAFFAKRRRPGLWRGRRLMHYISAGGMGQMRRTTADDIQEMRQGRFWIALGIAAAFWVLFLFAPLP